MYSNSVISVDKLGKCYQIYNKPHERLLQSFFRGKRTYFKAFWALRDVSLEVRKGETVGIVGRNGSGKTTLLQLICGTLLATEGTCTTKGRVAALLALGAGFNQEYSGEENVNLYASLFGLSKMEIANRFHSICEFADIGDFISQPVKKYSSGMYMRLAFAVAVHVEPDILIVDEALAVGDEAFQRKCYAKLEELKEGGMTLLFVSHSSGSIISLCDRAVLLEKGVLLASGKPKTVISLYHKLLFAPPTKVDTVITEIKSITNINDITAVDSKAKLQKIRPHYLEGMQSKSILYYVSRGATIMEPSIYTLVGDRVNVLCKGEKYVYSYRVVFSKTCQHVRFGMLIKTLTGVELGGFSTSSRCNTIATILAGSEYSVTFSFRCRLNPGVYFLNAGVNGLKENKEIYLHRIIDALMIRVMPVDDQKSTGVVDFEMDERVSVLQQGSLR